jgi:hypothetical protein
MARRLRAPSPALLIALLALFVSIGGVGYAASKIDTNDIKNKAVTKPKIDKQAVTSNRLADQAAKTKKIADQAVTTDKLGDQAVSTNKLGDQAVSTNKLGDQAVSTDKLGDQAVSTNKLGDQAVTTSKIAGGAVTDEKLASPRLFATVAPANANAQIVRGRGATDVNRVTTGSFRVTFNRNVQNCTWLATYGTPGNQFVDAKFATVRGRDPNTLPNDVGVVIRDTNGNQVDGLGFHVEVLCP